MSGAEARVTIGRGPRALEAALVERVLEQCAAAVANPELLARPVRVLVPSASLRDHLSERLVATAGRPLLGLRVQTLYSAALEILDRDRPAPVAGDLLFPAVVSQAARAHPALRDHLEPLLDGYATAAATVADLLDAGLEPADAPRLEEALESVRDARGARANALVATALATAARLAELGIRRSGDVLAEACRELERLGMVGTEGMDALPSRSIWIHGFAETTGRAGELLEAFARLGDARVWIDLPPDPADPTRPDAGAAFTERLTERFALTRPEEIDSAVAAPEIELVETPGAETEVRCAAVAIAAELDRGTRPERVGVVARSLEPYGLALRRHFRRLGVPFSSDSARGPRTAGGRRLQAATEILRLREAAPTDTWLEAIDGALLPEWRRDRDVRRADVSLALHALGEGRLRDIAALDIDSLPLDDRGLPLPARRGLVQIETGESADGSGEEEGDARTRVVAPRRRLEREALEAAIAQAQALCARFERWVRHGDAGAQLDELTGLLDDELGLSDHAATDAVRDDLRSQLPRDFALRLPDFAALFARAAADVERAPLGGAGAGVQVLDATAARGRTFDVLYLLGANRDQFPRGISEDPLLPDDVRERMRAVLPDLPVKRAGHTEERYLFAQLVAASPRIAISWQRTDDDGHARAPSTFVDRIRIARPELAVTAAPGLWSATDAGPRPAHELLVTAGLHGTRKDVARVLPAALEAAGAATPARELAAAHIAVLDELDPDASRAQQLGPYFGFVGPVKEPADPRHEPVYVTTLEGLARCPWRSFLQRILRIEPRPDAMETLPRIDALLLGSSVHGLLERIAGGRATAPLSELLEQPGSEVPWPADEELVRMARTTAQGLLERDGVGLASSTRASSCGGMAAPRSWAARSRARSRSGRSCCASAPISSRARTRRCGWSTTRRASRATSASPTPDAAASRPKCVPDAFCRCQRTCARPAKSRRAQATCTCARISSTRSACWSSRAPTTITRASSRISTAPRRPCSRPGIWAHFRRASSTPSSRARARRVASASCATRACSTTPARAAVCGVASRAPRRAAPPSPSKKRTRWPSSTSST